MYRLGKIVFWAFGYLLMLFLRIPWVAMLVRPVAELMDRTRISDGTKAPLRYGLISHYFRTRKIRKARRLAQSLLENAIDDVKRSEFEYFALIGPLGVVRSVTEICQKFGEQVPSDLLEYLRTLEDEYCSTRHEIQDASSYRQVQQLVGKVRDQIVEKSKEHGELPGCPS